MTLLHMLLVGIGGFFGSIFRFFVNNLNKRLFSNSFPLATMSVNSLGSFLFGLLIGFQLDERLMLLVGIGFLGAFTTFSAFTLESMQLYLEKRKRAAYFNVMINIGFPVLLAFFGMKLARMI